MLIKKEFLIIFYQEFLSFFLICAYSKSLLMDRCANRISIFPLNSEPENVVNHY